MDVGCYPELEDADGEPFYVARLVGTELAHRDLDKLIRDIEIVAEARFEAEQPPATMSSYYYDDLTRGTVGFEEVRRELRGDALTRIEATFRENGGQVEDAVIDEELVFDYPRKAIDDMLYELYRSGDVSYRDGQYIHHGHDRGGLFSWVKPWG